MTTLNGLAGKVNTGLEEEVFAILLRPPPPSSRDGGSFRFLSRNRSKIGHNVSAIKFRAKLSYLKEIFDIGEARVVSPVCPR